MAIVVTSNGTPVSVAGPTGPSGPAGTVGATGASGVAGLAGSGGGLPAVTVTPSTAAAALTVGQHTPVDATAGAVAMTLPTAQAANKSVSIEKYDSTVNAVTVTGNIRGVASTTITLSLPHETVTLVTDANGSYWPEGSHKTLSSLDIRYGVGMVTVVPVSGIIPIDLSKGSVFKVAAQSAAITDFAVTNRPASGAADFKIYAVQDSTGGHAFGLASANAENGNGNNPAFNTTALGINYVEIKSPDVGVYLMDATSGAVNDIYTQLGQLATAVGPVAGNVSSIAALQSQVAALTASLSAVPAVAEHGTNASFPRPPVTGPVIWLGSATPTNANTGDPLFTSGFTILSATPHEVQTAVSSAYPTKSGSVLSVPISALQYAPTVGNTLIIPIFMASTSTVTGVIDPYSNNVWSIDVATAPSTYQYLALLRLPIATAHQLTDVIQVQCSTTPGSYGASIAEFSPLPASPLDQTAQGSSATATTAISLGTTAATSEAVELVIGAFIGNGSLTGSFATLTALQSAGATPYLRWGYKYTTATGTQNPVYTASVGRIYSGFTATYKTS